MSYTVCWQERSIKGQLKLSRMKSWIVMKEESEENSDGKGVRMKGWEKR